MTERCYRWFEYGVAIFVLCVAFWNIHRLDFGGDAVKYALDIGYPHPPLLRSLMYGNQFFFGIGSWQARLPVIFLQLNSGLLAFLLLQKRGVERLSAIGLSVVITLAPGALEIARFGFLSPAFLWATILLWLGCDDLEKEKRAGSALLLLASAFACASLLQSVLLFPSILLIVWRFHKKAPELWLALAPFFLLMGYVATSPLILADILSFTHRTNIQPLFSHDPWLLAYATIGLTTSAWAWIRVRTSVLCISGTIFASIVALFLWRHPENYYVPFALSSTVTGLVCLITSLNRITQRRIAVCAILGTLMYLPIGFHKEHWDDWNRLDAGLQDFFHVNNQQQEIMMLGTFGYEFDHASPVLLRKFASDKTVRSKIQKVLLLHPESLTKNENDWLSQQKLTNQINNLMIYDIINP